MAFKMKGSSYKMGGHKTKSTMAYMKSPLEQAKPDYPDIDKDGNTTESMKQAAADKKSSALKDKKFHKKNSTKEDKVGVLDHNIKHSDNIWNENHEVNPEEDRTQRKLRMDVPAIEDRFEDDAPTTMKSSGFKMKGFSGFQESASPMKKMGVWKTDVDDLTGEKTTTQTSRGDYLAQKKAYEAASAALKEWQKNNPDTGWDEVPSEIMENLEKEQGKLSEFALTGEDQALSHEFRSDEDIQDQLSRMEDLETEQDLIDFTRKAGAESERGVVQGIAKEQKTDMSGYKNPRGTQRHGERVHDMGATGKQREIQDKVDKAIKEGKDPYKYLTQDEKDMQASYLESMKMGGQQNVSDIGVIEGGVEGRDAKIYKHPKTGEMVSFSELPARLQGKLASERRLAMDAE